MARTYLHKIEGKFNNSLIDLDDVPVNVRNKWDRKNFEGGKLKMSRKKRTEKFMDNNLKYTK